jgi:N-acetylneuraminic acid mutarotase
VNGFVVYGGRNDTYSHQYFNDLWYFNLFKDYWQQIKFGQEMTRRAGHCAETSGENILIFGGFNQDGYICSDVTMISLADGAPKDECQFQVGLVPHPENFDDARHVVDFVKGEGNAKFNSDVRFSMLS